MFQMRFKDLFDVDTLHLASGYTLGHIIINVLLATLCGLIIYGVYKRTYSGVLLSKSMGITLVILSVITSLIVMTISGNIALSLGMVGALSIVRFRTPIKDPRDTAFIFWSITSGIICGVSAYQMAFVSVVSIGLCLFALSKRLSFCPPYLLVLKLMQWDEKNLEATLNTNCRKIKQRSLTASDKETEIVFEVQLKNIQASDFLKKIKAIAGIHHVAMISYEGELDEAR